MAITKGEVQQGILEYTKEELVEFKKCKDSFVYFMTHYVYIRDKEGKIVQFKPWKKQLNFIENMQKHKWLLVAAARQVGKSVIVGGFALWLGLFYPNQNIVVMSKNGNAAKKFLKKVKLIYGFLPDFLKKHAEPFIQNAVHTIEFNNRSMIESINTTEDGPRGDSLSLLIWDEAAFTPENIQDDLWSAASPAVNKNRLIMISTFKNDDPDNLFFRLYDEFKDNTGKFKVIDDMNWRTDPSRDDTWYENEKKTYKKSLAKFYREYDVIPGIPDKCDFNVMKLLELEKKIKDEKIKPVEKDDEMGIVIYEEPIKGIEYVIGADVAEGNENNSHACQVFRLDNLKQVATFQNNQLEISDFANVCYNLGTMYNNALIIPERNNVGHGLIEVLETSLYYENLYIAEDGRIGVVTTGASKEKMFNYTASGLMYDLFELVSLETVRQMKLFKKKYTNAEKKNKKDDLVMALMVMLYGIVDLNLNNFFTDVLQEKLTNSEEIGNRLKALKDRIYNYHNKIMNDVVPPDVYF